MVRRGSTLSGSVASRLLDMIAKSSKESTRDEVGDAGMRVPADQRSHPSFSTMTA